MKRNKVFLSLALILLVSSIGFSIVVMAQEDWDRRSSVDLEVSCDDFRFQNDIRKSVKLRVHDRLNITLCSNQTTGFEWPDSAQVSDHTVMWQTSHTSLSSDCCSLGAPGGERWTFQALNEGTTTISLRYSRPWEEESEDDWTFRVYVTVVEERKPREEKSSKEIGENLVRELFDDIKKSDVSDLKRKISDDFQAVGRCWVRNREEEIKTLKGSELGELTLSNFTVTREGDTLVVTYTVEFENGKSAGDPIPRLSVFLKTDSDWKLVAHVDLS